MKIWILGKGEFNPLPPLSDSVFKYNYTCIYMYMYLHISDIVDVEVLFENHNQSLSVQLHCQNDVWVAVGANLRVFLEGKDGNNEGEGKGERRGGEGERERGKERGRGRGRGRERVSQCSSLCSTCTCTLLFMAIIALRCTW